MKASETPFSSRFYSLITECIDSSAESPDDDFDQMAKNLEALISDLPEKMAGIRLVILRAIGYLLTEQLSQAVEEMMYAYVAMRGLESLDAATIRLREPPIQNLRVRSRD